MPELPTITDPQLQLFYTQFKTQRDILYDFYIRLPEAHYDFRMVDTPERRSDSPRESLAHLLDYRLTILHGIKTQKLEFISMQVEHYWQSTKTFLLGEWERIENELFTFLTDTQTDCHVPVSLPWGQEWSRLETLYLLRDHDILHIGWNLALMDHLNIERFPSLRDYWG